MISGNPKTNNRFINRHKIDKKINTLICDYLYENVMTNENITNNQSVNKLIQFLLNKEIIMIPSSPNITIAQQMHVVRIIFEFTCKHF